MVLSGATFKAHVPNPPASGFAYPFVCWATCASASKIVDWVEAAARTIGDAVERCASQPVVVIMPEPARKLIGPPAKWLEELGFQQDGCTFSSSNPFH